MGTPMRVTFDTNTLDKAVRPERFPKDPNQPVFFKIHQAILDGLIAGFICETIIILEGIKKDDRAEVFASTNLRQKPEELTVLDDGTTSIRCEYTSEQKARKPLPPAFFDRVQAALSLGIRVMGAPRIGGTKIDDPDKKIYVCESDNKATSNRIDRYHSISEAIEARRLGTSHAKQLGQKFSQRDNMKEPWYRGLQRARNIHERNEVVRAIAEWADADSIAAHFGYSIDYFCSEDRGKSGGKPSILNQENRTWLETEYGIVFVTLSQLSSKI